jgi:hypothetical protein
MMNRSYIFVLFVFFLVADNSYGNVKDSCSNASCRPIKIVREIR